MEKITIQGIEEKKSKTNVPFWAVKFTDGRSGTVWDDQIANYMSKDVKIGGSCEVEIKTTPSGYNNIRSVNFESAQGNTQPVQEKVVDVVPSVQNNAPNPQRVGLYIKLAVEMLIAAPVEGKTVEENLCENIQEIKKLEEFTIGLLSQ
ncbi:MAG: hypothetical protein GY861_28705 [bacterium]|nr:hypothetical protein [bacterium]